MFIGFLYIFHVIGYLGYFLVDILIPSFSSITSFLFLFSIFLSEIEAGMYPPELQVFEELGLLDFNSGVPLCGGHLFPFP